MRNELFAAQAAFDQGRAADARDLLQRLMLQIESASSRYARLGSADLAWIRLLEAGALALRGEVLRALGEADAGQAALEQAIAEFEEWLPSAGRWTSQARGTYALTLEAAGRHGDALAALEQAVGEGAVSAPAYRLLARHRQAQGELEAAADLCRRSLNMAPDSLDAEQTLAEILEALGHTSDALDSYRQVANLLAAAGRNDEALAVAEHILALAPNDIDGLVIYGNLLRLRGEWEKALAALEHALTLDPTNPNALSMRGSVLIGLGRYEEGLASLDLALSYDPKFAWALAVKGDALRLLGRNEEALAVLEKALAQGEDDAWTLDTQAQVLYALGRDAEAITVVRGAAEANPKLAWVQAELAAGLRDAGQLDEALAAADRAWDLNPGDPGLLQLKIGILQRQGRFEEATVVLDEVLAQKPDDTYALWLLGDTLRLSKKCEEALATLDRALEALDRAQAPAQAKAECLGSRGLVLRELGDDRKAAGALVKATKLDSSLPWVARELGSVLIALGHPRPALKALDQALALDPKSAAAWRMKGEALRLLDRPADALDALDRSLKIEPDDTYALGTQGQVLKALGRNDAAVDLLKRAIQLAPEWSWLHDELGMLAGYEAVLAALDQALAHDPQNPKILSARGEALWLLRRFKEALDAVSRALELAPDDPFTLGIQGQVLRALKRDDEAAAALLRAVELNPELSWVYRELGALDRHEKALAILRQASNQSPQNWKLLNSMGKLLSEIGQFEQAASMHQRVIDMCPEDSEAHLGLAWALKHQGRGPDALHAYQDAIRRHLTQPDRPWALKGLADAWLMTGEGARAQALFRTLVTQIGSAFNVRDADSLTLLGWCHYQLGHFEGSHYEEALRCYSDALALTSDIATQFDLALALLCMGREDAARQEYEWALKLAGARSRPRQRGLLLVAQQDLREAETVRATLRPPLAARPIASLLENRLQAIAAGEAALEMA